MTNKSSKGNLPFVGSSRALRIESVRNLCAGAVALISRKSLTLAVMSVVALYVGISIDSLPVIFTVALAAIGFLYIAEHTKKGGEA